MSALTRVWPLGPVHFPRRGGSPELRTGYRQCPVVAPKRYATPPSPTSTDAPGTRRPGIGNLCSARTGMESVRACLEMTGFDTGLSKASPPPSSTRGTGNQQAASAASLRAPVTPPGAPVARSYGGGTESSAIWLSVMTVFIFAPRSPRRIAQRVEHLANSGLRHSKLLLLKLALKPYPGSRISDSRIGGCFS